MNKIILIGLACMLMMFSLDAEAKKKKKNSEADSTKVSDKYADFKKDLAIKEGIINILEKEGKYYFEVKDSVFQHQFLLGSRISEVSNNKDVLAGQQLRNPLLVRWEYDGQKVLLKEVQSRFYTNEPNTIGVALKRNYGDVILEAFKPEVINKDTTCFIIDVTKFFCSSRKDLSPFKQKGGLFSSGSTVSGTFESEKSKITSAKAFPKNLVIKSRMAYKVKDKPWMATMTRSLMLLPDESMQARLWDKRMGYFSDAKYCYTSHKDEMQKLRVINKWNLYPRPEDVDKQKRGELVEPANPIVYYVDTAIPEKWRKYIRLGIEDWQEAFEAAGFKNAIIAKDYPNDPNFDPDDMRYSCYRYITTHISNSMGPSWTDPRSGEIIQGDVLFYHNVIKILHSWRFVQTAAVDPSVRKRVFDEKEMGESIRYVAAHEIGHTLGLMHNMGASYSYPVDSLRSKSFTNKYGTTPSIMDYARYNYVAQPEDEGVSLLPPKLGVYDIHAIKWGYKPIYGANSPEDEYKTLNKWILEKQNDKMYTYGAQQILIENDPSAQSEALGDDAIKASLYGIKNLKLINKNLIKWTAEENQDYTYSESIYNTLFDQLFRYIHHVARYVGGVYLNNPVYGDQQPSHRFVSREKQKEAVDFLFTQINDLPNWIINEELQNHAVFMDSDVLAEYMGEITTILMNPVILSRLKQFELSGDPKAYTQLELMDDIYKRVFEKTINGKSLNYYDQVIQYEYVRNLMKQGKYSFNNVKSKAIFNEGLCSCSACSVHKEDVHVVTPDKKAGSTIVVNAIYDYELKKIYMLMKAKRHNGNKSTRIHYNNIYRQLQSLFE